MQIDLAHKIRLNPTPEQEQYFNDCANGHRFIYNWALEKYKFILNNGGKPKILELKKQFNSTYADEFPFLVNVHRDVRSQPFADLQTAFSNFFRGLREGRKARFPKFKSKKKAKQSFYVANELVSFDGYYIKIPKIGWVNMAEKPRFNTRIMFVRINKTGNHWYASISFRFDNVDVSVVKNRPSVGMDLGIKTLMTFSDDRDDAENQRYTLKSEKRLKGLYRKMRRQVEGSNNWHKTVKKIRATSNKIANQRKDYIDKLTTEIAGSYSIIAIEDLATKQMMKNHNLARHIADASFGEIKRQLEYKQYLYESQVIKVDRFYPSSKTCSVCGYVNKDLTLLDREWTCPGCKTYHNRDKNAATNIEKEGLRLACS